MTRLTWGLFAGFALCTHGCSRDPVTEPKPLPSVSAHATTPDRLAPGELGEGRRRVFGFVVPEKMRVEAEFLDSVHLSGRVTPQALADYVRARVLAKHVEVGAARTVFPSVRIKGAASDQVYRFELIPNGLQTRLVIKNVTKKPAARGLSQRDRLRRAGLTPDGEQLPDLE